MFCYVTTLYFCRRGQDTCHISSEAPETVSPDSVCLSESHEIFIQNENRRKKSRYAMSDLLTMDPENVHIS